MRRTPASERGLDDLSLLSRVVDARRGEPESDQRHSSGQRRKEDGAGRGCCSAGDLAGVILPFLLEFLGAETIAFGLESVVIERHSESLDAG